MNQVLLILIVSGLQFTNKDAANRATEAYYKQSGVERALTEWTEQNTTPELRARVGEVTFITQSLMTRKIMFQWSF